jgi:NADPH:quinone reductase-like Zn-dependent oxidoreductase
MKAVRIHNYGGVDVLSLEEAPKPEAGEGQVLVRVHATTVNPFDCAARAGYLAGYYTYTFPHVLGLDVSGVVEAVGTGVAGFAPGDEVYARADPATNGAYAEYIALPVSEVAIKPESLNHYEAASLPQAGLTSWRTLFEAANLSAGQRVLIHAAAGGVGTVAVQLAKWRGAEVWGTASEHNHDYLRDLGADHAIDYNTTPFEEAVRDVDVVLDSVGGDTQERSWKVLKPGGALVSIVQPPSEETAAAHGVRQFFVGAYPPAGGVLGDVAALVKEGHVRPMVSSIRPLADIAQVHELVEGRHVRGKIVLSVAE